MKGCNGMDDSLLQLGLAPQPHKLAASSSYVQRGQPAYSTNTASGWLSGGGMNAGASAGAGGATTPYVTQLATVASASSGSARVLLSYTDDDVLRQHDMASLRVLGSSKWSEGGACTSLKSAASMVGYVMAGRNGMIGYWDTRQKPARDQTSGGTDRPTISFAGPSRAPYTALDLAGNAIVAGTELQGVDARIDLWDVRKPAAPVLTYEETHSDDITSLAFHPSAPHVLLSASSDALIAVSDTRQANEDDSVVGVVNTEASVARAGWGGSGHTFPKAQGGEEMDQSVAALPALGAFWGVSDMQTVGIWEADSFSELLPLCDVRQTQCTGPLATMDKEQLSGSDAPVWQSEYIVDASADSSLLENVEGIGLFCGEQNGGMVLIEVPNSFEPEKGNHADTASASVPRHDWLLHCRTSGGHSEVVRSIAWDAENYTLFSGGEDGRICAWSLDGEKTDGIPIRSQGSTDQDERNESHDSIGPARGKGANAVPVTARSGQGAGRIGKASNRDNGYSVGSRDRLAYKPY